jgi:hypothetical protein
MRLRAGSVGRQLVADHKSGDMSPHSKATGGLPWILKRIQAVEQANGEATPLGLRFFLSLTQGVALGWIRHPLRGKGTQGVLPLRIKKTTNGQDAHSTVTSPFT